MYGAYTSVTDIQLQSLSRFDGKGTMEGYRVRDETL